MHRCPYRTQWHLASSPLRPHCVRWHHTDYPFPPTATSTSSSAASSDPPPPASPGELGTGAWVGIGVGAGISALLSLALVVWLCLRRRRHHARRLRDGAGDLVLDYAKAELEANPANITNPELVEDDGQVEPELPDEALGSRNDGHVEPGLPGEALVSTDGARELPAARGNELGELLPSAENEEAREPAELGVAPQDGMAEPAAAEEESSTNVIAPVTPAVGASNWTEERARLAQEESQLAARRATLQETIRLLEEEERLGNEREAVRRRLEELRRAR